MISMTFVVIAALIVWFVIGAVTFWYMETRACSRDIGIETLPLMFAVSCCGFIAFLYAVGYTCYYKFEGMVIFKAKKRKE